MINFIFITPTYAQWNDSFEQHKTYILNIKTNPFTIFQGPILYTAEYRLGFEKPIATFSTIQIMAAYLGKSPYVYLAEAAMSYNDEIKINGYRFQAEYKYYFLARKKGTSPFEGFYTAANASYSKAYITNYYFKMRAQGINATYQYIALKFGYQHTVNNYTFDFFYGMGYRDITWQSNLPYSNTQKLNRGDFVPFDNAIKILLGFNIGFRI
ncbi:MAG: hypothetical protein HPY79_10180 [Bacteroidales bacterium]|nr:hypothetical protein [Bacteroidales bacterium]